jgi:ubiquinol-cytochrome c reductase iron-sulfur subunit
MTERQSHPDGGANGGQPDAEIRKLVVPGEVEPERTRRAERRVAALLVAAGGLGFVFCLLFAFAPDNTQLLGLSFGLALLMLAAALLLAAERVVPQETDVEPRPVLAETREVEERHVAAEVAGAARGVSRRRLLGRAAGVAGAGLGAAAIVPLASLGPNVGETLYSTPWRKGTPLVDEQGNLITADDIIPRSFMTAFPQGADMRELGSPVVVVRVDPSTLQLPAGRAGWAPEGILAYSKICTHAGCAVSLYRAPLDQSTSQLTPALVCPCHYSTFDVRRGAAVEFGPAARPLPQLPLMIRSDRVLVAGGGFSGPIGPSWWGVRREGRTRYAP